jgi:hypothetical protein
LVLGRLAHLTVEAEQEWIEPLTQTRLLREPSTEDGRQALAEVAQDAGIPIVRPYPLTPAQWAALTGLTLLGFVGMVLELTS